MVQAKERSQGKGFEQNRSQDSQDKGTGATSGEGAKPVEVAELQQQLDESLYGVYQAYEVMKAQHLQRMQELKDYIVRDSYQMLMAQPVFGQAAEDLGKLISNHPRMAPRQMPPMEFTPLRLKPFSGQKSSTSLLQSSEENE